MSSLIFEFSMKGSRVSVGRKGLTVFHIFTFLWMSEFKFGTTKRKKYPKRPNHCFSCSPSLPLHFCLSPLLHVSPTTSFALQRESKASVYYEEPRALCRVVLSNNNQWRQRLSVWAREREGNEAGKKTGKGGGEAEKQTCKYYRGSEALSSSHST